MEREPTYPLELFYCYARKDRALRDELDIHLAGLRHSGLITTWYDGEISPGISWEQEIKTHLEKAHVILLLVSPDFLNSDYCYSKEMIRALERHNEGTAHVIPVILRPVDLRHVPFGKIQALPTNAKPITSWPDRDNAYLDVVNGIEKAIGNLTSSPLVEAPPVQSEVTTHQLTREQIKEAFKNRAGKVKLDGINLEKLDLSGLDLRYGTFRKANLRQANLSKAQLGGEGLLTWLESGFAIFADLEEANLCEANLESADLRYANFVKAQLRNARLKGAQLKHTKLSGADLREADLSSTDLRGVELRAFTRIFSLTSIVANLGGANLQEAILVGLSADHINLENANLQGVNARNIEMNWGNFKSANMQYAILHNASLLLADLTGADLTGADLTGADLGNADLTGANLAGTILQGTKYNPRTQWPEGFIPIVAGAVLYGK